MARLQGPCVATHAVGSPARYSRSVAARCRTLRHRPRPGPRRPLERPDHWRLSRFRSPSTRCWCSNCSAPTTPIATPVAQLQALLHDAPEYVMGDIISPFKAAMGGNYKDVENRLLSAIYLRFSLPAAMPAAARQAGQEGRPRGRLLRGHPPGRLRGCRGPQILRRTEPAGLRRRGLRPPDPPLADPRGA